MENGADIAAENIQELTPLHSAYKNNHTEATGIIEAFAKKHCPQFLDTFDINKPRNLKKKVQFTYTALDYEVRWRVLDGDVSMTGIAKKILSGHFIYGLYFK